MSRCMYREDECLALRQDLELQRYDWKCDCGHMESSKTADGPWCAAKTAIERISLLEATLLAAITEWEQKHGPWRDACGADHWVAVARALLGSTPSGGADGG